MSATGGGGPGSHLRVCKHPCHRGGTRRGEKGELTSCRGTVQSQEGRPGVVRRWQSSLISECARVTGKAGENGQNSGDGAARSPQDRSCGDTTKASASFGSIWGGDQGNLSVAQFERSRPDGWKGGRPRVRLENRACEPARSPKITSAQGPQ